MSQARRQHCRVGDSWAQGIPSSMGSEPTELTKPLLPHPHLRLLRAVLLPLPSLFLLRTAVSPVFSLSCICPSHSDTGQAWGS